MLRTCVFSAVRVKSLLLLDALILSRCLIVKILTFIDDHQDLYAALNSRRCQEVYRAFGTRKKLTGERRINNAHKKGPGWGPATGALSAVT